MRRAMPYPCSGPMDSRVFKTMRSSVPCKTSDLPSGMFSPVGSAQEYDRAPCGMSTGTLLRNVVSEAGKLIDLRHGGAGVDRLRRQRHAFEEAGRSSGSYQRRTGIDQHDIPMRAHLAGKNGASDIAILRRVSALEIRQCRSPHAEAPRLQNAALD